MSCLRRTWYGILHVTIFMLSMGVPMTTHAQKYDVISIKPNAVGSQSMSINAHDDLYSATNVNLKMLIAMAYEVRQSQISGLPKWALDGHWDIQAKVLDATPAQINLISGDQRRRMLQDLLKDGFRLQLHHQATIQSVLELQVAPDGLKMKPHISAPGTAKTQAAGGMSMGTGRLDAHDVPASAIARAIGEVVGRSVVDKTNLTGTWDVALRWAMDDGQESDDPPLNTAIHDQLGLVLKSGKAEVDGLVIDSISDPTTSQ